MCGRLHRSRVLYAAAACTAWCVNSHAVFLPPLCFDCPVLYSLTVFVAIYAPLLPPSLSRSTPFDGPFLFPPSSSLCFLFLSFRLWFPLFCFLFLFPRLVVFELLYRTLSTHVRMSKRALSRAVRRQHGRGEALDANVEEAPVE